MHPGFPPEVALVRLLVERTLDVEPFQMRHVRKGCVIELNINAPFFEQHRARFVRRVEENGVVGLEIKQIGPFNYTLFIPPQHMKLNG